jgi:hypothetical protein
MYLLCVDFALLLVIFSTKSEGLLPALIQEVTNVCFYCLGLAAQLHGCLRYTITPMQVLWSYDHSVGGKFENL